MQEQVRRQNIPQMVISKQRSLALRNPKLHNWLRLLQQYKINNSFSQMDSVILDHMHYYFILDQDFWLKHTERKLSKGQTYSAIDFAFCAFDDGHYFALARLLHYHINKMHSNHQLRSSYVAAKMEKLSLIFKYNRVFAPQIQRMYRATITDQASVRRSYRRQIAEAYDNFDVTYNSYLRWEEKREYNRESIQGMYEQTKNHWEQLQMGVVNGRQELLKGCQEKNAVIFIRELPTQQQKIWYLRRIFLSQRKCVWSYLQKVQHLMQEEEVIKIFKGALGLCDNEVLAMQVQTRFITFLNRRINKQLLQGKYDEDYAAEWGNRVGQLRQQLENLMSKTRLNSVEQIYAYGRLERLAIAIEVHVTKDKVAVEKLFQHRLKIGPAPNESIKSIYKHYGDTLLAMGAYGDAGNVFRRCYQALGQSQFYDEYLQLYGSIEMQCKFTLHKESKLQVTSIELPPPPIQQAKQKKLPLTDEAQFTPQLDNKSLRRTAPSDDTSLKIQANQRKRLHTDANSTLFLSKMDPNWTQSDVLNNLHFVGEVSQVRLIKKNNQKMDYCYIEYKSQEAAGKEMAENKRLQLARSRPPSMQDESNTLFLCALPQNTTQAHIRQLFHPFALKEIRLKLNKDKNICYVECEQEREQVLEDMKKRPLMIMGKKIILKLSQSERGRSARFVKVVYLKGLAYKAKEQDVREFFRDRKVKDVLVPRDEKGRTRGFGYVQFETFKDYQQVLDLRRISILGREVQVCKSERIITHPNKKEPNALTQDKKQEKSTFSKEKQEKKQPREEKKQNTFFSNLFK